MVEPINTTVVEAKEEESINRITNPLTGESISLEGEIIGNLSAILKTKWTKAVDAKLDIEKVMLDSLRDINGEYNPEKLKALEEVDSVVIYMMIAAQKVRDAKAWLYDVMEAGGDHAWSLDPTPIPDMPMDKRASVLLEASTKIRELAGNYQAEFGTLPSPEEVTQATLKLKEALGKEVEAQLYKEAQESAAKMTTKIDDQLTEAKWKVVFRDFIHDVVVYPAGFVKCPVLRKKPALKWELRNGAWEANKDEKIQIELERVSPFDIYPEPGIANIEDGYIFEKHASLSRQSLYELIGVPGYREDAIRRILQTYESAGYNESLSDIPQREILEGKSAISTLVEKGVDALQFWGNISGKVLKDNGVKGITDEEREYPIEAWLVGDEVIKVVLNQEPLQRKPYIKVCWDDMPGSFWGQGVPRVIKDVTELCNAAARAIGNNMALACLTGDTVVYKNQDTKEACHTTLDELWEAKHVYNSGLRRIKLRSVNEETGEIFYNRVVDIFDNGIRPVYRVTTTSGYTIKATDNHRFMNDIGEWQCLSEFAIGDKIVVNGKEEKIPSVCQDCRATLVTAIAIRCRSCASKTENSTWNKKQALDAMNNINANETTARGRWSCQRHKKDVCEKCGIKKETGVDLHIHHIDKNPHNNIEKNLLTLCEKCHHFIHMRYDNFGNAYGHKFVDYNTIKEIEYVGEERVFDLQMTAPNHNFIANGFVSHNSGPQIEVNVDRVESESNNTEIWPWKIWLVNNKQFQDGNAIKFTNVPLVAAELMAIYNKFKADADDQSGIPSYVHGSPQARGAGATASGLSMLLSATARGIKYVVIRLDDAIAEVVTRLYDFNMLYDNDQKIKGDLRVRVKGSSTLIAKEQLALRRNEFMITVSNYLSANIPDESGQPLISPKMIRILLKEQAKTLELPELVELLIGSKIPEKTVTPAGKGGPVAPAPAPVPSIGQIPQPTASPEALVSGEVAGGRDANLVS